MTALLLAAKNNKRETVEALLSKGADILAVDNKGRSVVDVCDDEDLRNFLENELQIRRQGGSKEVKRAMLILVGNGEAGKTTLVHRLRDKDFLPDGHGMTDGIDMSRLEIDGVDFTVMDFAGQKEYAHTHALFFKDNAIYLLVVKPRSEGGDHAQLANFLEMIRSFAPKAPVLLVATRAAECELTEEQKQGIRAEYPEIQELLSVDSKNGFGIPELEQTLVQVALGQSETVKQVPYLFFNLEKNLREYNDKNKTVFSISTSDFVEFAMREVSGLDEDNCHIALKLFAWWGFVHVLSNGDVVLRPQQLADVLACVVSKKPETLTRIGEPARFGTLLHDESTLSAVWEDYDPRLWQIESATVSRSEDEMSESAPAFLNLLYQSGLAFPLYDAQGNSAGKSLVPSMLRELPYKFSEDHSTKPSDTSLYDHFFRSFFPASFIPYETLTLIFEKLPSIFFSRLQVALCHLAVQEGSWLNGCALVTQTKTGYSFALLYHGNPQELSITISGDRSARSLIISELLGLMKSSFPAVAISDFTLRLEMNGKSTMATKSDIEEALEDEGYIIMKKLKIPLQTLAMLCRHILLKGGTKPGSSGYHKLCRKLCYHKLCYHKESMQMSGQSDTALEEKGVVKSSDVAILEPVELRQLVTVVEHAEENLEKDLGVDVSSINQCIIKSIPIVLKLMNLEGRAGRFKTDRLRALWLVCECNSGTTLKAIPLTPGCTYDSPWEFVEEAAVTIVIDMIEEESRQIKTLKELLKRTISCASQEEFDDIIPKEYKDIRIPRKLDTYLKELVIQEKKYFQELKDNIMICKKYFPARSVMVNLENLEVRMEQGFSFLSKQLQEGFMTLGQTLGNVSDELTKSIALGNKDVQKQFSRFNDALQSMKSSEINESTLSILLEKHDLNISTEITNNLQASMKEVMSVRPSTESNSDPTKDEKVDALIKMVCNAFLYVFRNVFPPIFI